MTKALIIGGISFNTMIYVDEFPAPLPQTIFPKHYHETVGSTGAGKALNLQKLGWDVTLHGFVGADIYGEIVKDHLAHHGITFLHDHDPRGTHRHVSLMDQHGRRMSILFNSGTHEQELDECRLNALIPDVDILHLSITNYSRRFIAQAQVHGKSLWIDLHDYDGKSPYYQDFIDAGDVLMLSSDALPDYRAFMQAMIDAGKQVVVCTHGKDGSTALTQDGAWIETPALAYELVDSNGDLYF